MLTAWFPALRGILKKKMLRDCAIMTLQPEQSGGPWVLVYMELHSDRLVPSSEGDFEIEDVARLCNHDFATRTVRRTMGTGIHGTAF